MNISDNMGVVQRHVAPQLGVYILGVFLSHRHVQGPVKLDDLVYEGLLRTGIRVRAYLV